MNTKVELSLQEKFPKIHILNEIAQIVIWTWNFGVLKCLYWSTKDTHLIALKEDFLFLEGSLRPITLGFRKWESIGLLLKKTYSYLFLYNSWEKKRVFPTDIRIIVRLPPPLLKINADRVPFLLFALNPIPFLSRLILLLLTHTSCDSFRLYSPTSSSYYFPSLSNLRSFSLGFRSTMLLNRPFLV